MLVDVQYITRLQHNHWCKNPKPYKNFYVHAVIVCSGWNYVLSGPWAEIQNNYLLETWNASFTFFSLEYKALDFIFTT
jgi:hypothetical protein